MKERIKKAFERAALTYGESAKLQKQIAQKTAAEIPQKNYERILEIGCGNGQSTLNLQRFLDSKIFALDLAPAMLKQAQKNCPSGYFFAADGENPPLRPKTFNLLFSSSCLQWYANPQKSIPELLQLLKKDGFFSISLFVYGTFKEILHCKKITGYGSSLDMLEAKYYVQIFQKYSQIKKYYTKNYTLFYPSFFDFVKENKKAGTFVTKAPIYNNKTKMQNFIETYDLYYKKNGQIPFSYTVLYISGTV